jgi:glycosyltransferase involved in cell wall biosynthesis
LYNVGASHLHHGVFQAMRLRPGPTIVHENNVLSYFYETWDILPKPQKREFLAFVGAQLGATVPTLEDLLERLDALPSGDRYSADLEIERLFLPYATIIFVHSQRLKRRFETLGASAPIHLIPLMAPQLTHEQRQAGRRRLGLSPETFVFGTFGFIGEYKRVDRILAAWQTWANRPAGTRLLIVGQRQYDIDIPKTDDIIYLDFVDSEEEFLESLAGCDCGIQLRHPTLGETSGVISTLLANTVPLIVSATAATQDSIGVQAIERIEPDEAEVDRLIAAMQRALERPRLARAYDAKYHPAACTGRIMELMGLSPPYDAAPA